MTVVFWTIVFVLVLCFGAVAFFGAPYVPTRRRDIAKAFDELYPLGKKDTLVDIGSGDGRLLRAASARGARAVGYELNPLLVLLTKYFSRKDRNVRVYCRNFWRQQLPRETTVVYTFLESRDIVKMERYMQKQASVRQKKLYFISYAFQLPNTPLKKQCGPLYLYEFVPRAVDL